MNRKIYLFFILVWTYYLGASLFALNEPLVLPLFPLLLVANLAGAFLPGDAWLEFGRSQSFPGFLTVLRIVGAFITLVLGALAWRERTQILSLAFHFWTIAVPVSAVIVSRTMPAYAEPGEEVLVPGWFYFLIVLSIALLVVYLATLARMEKSISLTTTVFLWLSSALMIPVAWFSREPCVTYRGDFQEGMAKAEVNNRWGFIDKTGRLVIRPRFLYAGSFSEGKAAVQIEDKKRIVSA